MQNKTRPSFAPEQVRRNVEQLARLRGESLGNLSRIIGRNDAYLQQFIRRGTPVRLDEDARLKLAQVLKVDERLLGAREPWQPNQPLDHSPSLPQVGEMVDLTSLSDADLIAAYQRTGGEQGDPVSDALLAEIERRDLDL